MNKLLDHKVALITGAARGIGKEIALLFASEGCDIAFTDLELDELTLTTEHEIQALGVRCRAYAADASSFQATEEVVKTVHTDMGQIDILVNNAGITRDGLLIRMSEKQWDEVINVNLKSAFNFMHAVSPIMIKQRSGSIISLSSVVGLTGNAGQTNYSASKAGIIALTRSVAQELGARGIRANAIAPGYIMTNMTATLPEEVRQNFLSRIPLRRGGTGREVAKVALFLASDMSSYVSGQVIQVNGGMN